MELILDVEINKNRSDHLQKLSQLIKEGWVIARIEEVKKDRANKDMLFVLFRPE